MLSSTSILFELKLLALLVPEFFAFACCLSVSLGIIGGGLRWYYLSGTPLPGVAARLLLGYR